MFLTRIEIDRDRRGARKLLGSPQAMHAAVLAGCPVGENETGRVLWRLDASRPRSLLYIASPVEPALDHLVAQAGTEAGWLTRDYHSLLNSLQADQRWAFRLTANVTVAKRLTPDAPRSQRYGHVTATQQRDWLVNRAGKFGFSIAENSSDLEALVVRDRSIKQFYRNGKLVTLATATFDGVLDVQDADALRSAMTSGIGPAKAYGCGLLTIAPLR